MEEPTNYEESGPGLRSFGLNSGYVHWVLREQEEPSMLPRLSRREDGRWVLPNPEDRA